MMTNYVVQMSNVYLEKKVMKNMWADPLSISILNISEMEGPSDEV